MKMTRLNNHLTCVILLLVRLNEKICLLRKFKKKSERKMKKVLLVVFVLLLAGCGPKYPEYANLNLQVIPQPGQVADNEAGVAISSKDRRDAPEVIVYQITEGASIQITNRNPPHILVSERLAIGLREQGFMVQSSATTHLLIEIEELQATVTKPAYLFVTEAQSRIALTVKNQKTGMTKNFSRQSTRKSVTSPETEDLEKLLNEQLSAIVNQTLADPDIRKLLKGE